MIISSPGDGLADPPELTVAHWGRLDDGALLARARYVDWATLMKRSFGFEEAWAWASSNASVVRLLRKKPRAIEEDSDSLSPARSWLARTLGAGKKKRAITPEDEIAALERSSRRSSTRTSRTEQSGLPLASTRAERGSVMKRVRPTPLGALVRGLVAGAVGSAVQSLFFKLTSRVAPAPQRDAFSPPDPAQLEEPETATIARRFVEGMMQRPRSDRAKKVGAKIVHYAFGALWGALYGLSRESLPAARRPAAALVFGGVVWLFGDELLVPAFRLSGPPGAYPLKTHAYALGAHWVYGASVWAVYEALRPRSLAVAAAALWALQMDVAIAPHLPRAARPILRAAISSAARMRARRPIAAAVEALRAA